jgi:hypothetical protein
MVDYDRYRSNLTKLQSKNEKSVSDEKLVRNSPSNLLYDASSKGNALL